MKRLGDMSVQQETYGGAQSTTRTMFKSGKLQRANGKTNFFNPLRKKQKQEAANPDKQLGMYLSERPLKKNPGREQKLTIFMVFRVSHVFALVLAVGRSGILSGCKLFFVTSVILVAS